MGDLWDRLPRLVGRDLQSEHPRGRHFTVVDVQSDAVIVRIQAGARRRGTAREYRIVRDEVLAIARLGVYGAGAQEPDLAHLSSFAYPGYVIAMLRELGWGGEG